MLKKRAPPLDLKRKPATRRPKAIVYIFSEGKNTEPNYFRLLAQACNTLVKIEAPCGVPKSVVKTAVDFRKKTIALKRNSFEKEDQYWAVFDKDDHDISSAFDQAKSNRVKIAFSNPCFEVWALIHCCEHDKPLHRHDLQRLLEDKMPGYDMDDKKEVNYLYMSELLCDAISRARRMRKNRETEGDPLGNPYTSVDKLVNDIIDRGSNFELIKKIKNLKEKL